MLQSLLCSVIKPMRRWFRTQMRRLRKNWVSGSTLHLQGKERSPILVSPILVPGAVPRWWGGMHPPLMGGMSRTVCAQGSCLRSGAVASAMRKQTRSQGGCGIRPAIAGAAQGCPHRLLRAGRRAARYVSLPSARRQGLRPRLSGRDRLSLISGQGRCRRRCGRWAEPVS